MDAVPSMARTGVPSPPQQPAGAPAQSGPPPQQPAGTPAHGGTSPPPPLTPPPAVVPAAVQADALGQEKPMNVTFKQVAALLVGCQSTVLRPPATRIKALVIKLSTVLSSILDSLSLHRPCSTT